MKRFIAGLLIGALLTQPSETILTTRIVREGTAPNKDIYFWHFLDVGGTCSADIDSPMGKAMLAHERPFDSKEKWMMTIKPYTLMEISR